MPLLLNQMNCERERFKKIRSGLRNREKIFHITYEEASDYKKLCSLQGKSLVDYQIERIKVHHYIGYMNFDRIDQMCKEYEARKTVSPPKSLFFITDLQSVMT